MPLTASFSRKLPSSGLLKVGTTLTSVVSVRVNKALKYWLARSSICVPFRVCTYLVSINAVASAADCIAAFTELARL